VLRAFRGRITERGLLSITLWRWLNLVPFPIAIAVAPIPYLRRSTLKIPARTTLLASVGAGGLLVLASYEVPLRWTGFAGNTLWDWLKLLLPPLAVLSVACVGSLRSVLLSDRGLRLRCRLSPARWFSGRPSRTPGVRRWGEAAGGAARGPPAQVLRRGEIRRAA